ncbi:PtdIns(3,5)P(2) sythesis regulation factor [Pestalotiopsis sp. IQ-011]
MPDSNVRISIGSDNVYIGDTIEKVSVFNTLLVKVGPDEIIDEDDPDEEYPTSWDLPELVLDISSSSPGFKMEEFRIGHYLTDPDLGSRSNFSIAREWLRSCRQDHQGCRFDCTPPLPTRVIDVGFDDDFRDARLLCSKGMEAEYMALSHCWGGPISPLLTDDTLEQFQESLPVTELSANFKDAIIITRQLGIQYLWIDSLCIIQSSRRDWEIESKRMGHVYGNATVTLSAMASQGSKGGILKNILVDLSPPPADIPVTSSNHALVAGPLQSRGWTLQEFVLSPRHLFYGAHQIYWKCAAGYLNVDGSTHGLRFPDNGYDDVAAILSSGLRSDDEQEPVPSPDVILQEYYRLITAYSERNLTVPSDKLPAFSGLAQGLHGFLGGEYLAGLWSSDVHSGLLWFREMATARHASPYRAPSWSWAVTNERIQFEIDRTELWRENPLAAELVAHEVTPADGTNPYGEVRAGALTLRGLTRPLVCSRKVIQAKASNHDHDVLFLDETEEGQLHSPDSIFSVGSGEGRHLVALYSTFGEPDEEVDIDPELHSPQQLMLLYIQRSTSFDHFLALKPVNESPHGNTYERVGLARADPKTPEELEKWSMQTVVLI